MQERPAAFIYLQASMPDSPAPTITTSNSCIMIWVALFRRNENYSRQVTLRHPSGRRYRGLRQRPHTPAQGSPPLLLPLRLAPAAGPFAPACVARMIWRSAHALRPAIDYRRPTLPPVQARALRPANRHARDE